MPYKITAKKKYVKTNANHNNKDIRQLQNEEGHKKNE